MTSIAYIERADWGAREATDIYPIKGKDEGIVVHYTTRDSAGFINSHWPDCYTSVQRHQQYHQSTRGWSDLAYNFVVCIHGFAFVGRGWSRRNGANTPVNERSLSIALDVDADDWFDIAAVRTVNALIAEAVDNQGWADKVRGHGEVSTTGTECPGHVIQNLIDSGEIGYEGDPTPIEQPDVSQPPPEAVVGTLELTGPPSTEIDAAIAYSAAQGATERFQSVIPYIWDEALALGLDPAPIVALAGHETGFGRFGGVVKPYMNNWGGLKVPSGGGDYVTAAHAKFTSDRLGVRALVQHVANYAGVRVHPDELVDPRWSEDIFGDAQYLPSAGWLWSSTPDAHARKIVEMTEGMWTYDS